MAELLIGCGNSRERKVRLGGHQESFGDLVTLDIDPNANPDVEWNLERLPLPFPDERFDAIHAYEVLEHVGRQGDWRFFLDQFADFWRILKPGGLLIGTSPNLGSRWLWGDPGHTRVISPECLTFLVQPEYDKQVGKSAISDYRHWYKADFDPMVAEERGEVLVFVMQAVKPSRISI